jgi:GNAT superfamily N-acetyltransferase
MFEIKRGILTPEQFNVLTESVGWGHPSIEQVKIALKNTLYTVCIVEGNKVVAMARMIGDNSMSYFIKDVVVIPEYQGKGVGKLIINDILSYIKERTPKDWKVSVELMSASGKEAFYEKFGFQKRPSTNYTNYGAGMFLVVK